MGTIKQVYAAEATIATTGLSDLADGSTALSDAIDNTTNLYLGAEIECKLTGTATTGVDNVDVYLVRSSDGTDFGTYATEEGKANVQFIGSVALNTNTAVVKLFRIEQLPPHWRLLFDNQSGAALTAETVVFRGCDLSN